jgi:adenine-specific DNA-methyltransferase
MPRKKKPLDAKPIEQYTHDDKDRVNNPPVGLVTPETDKEAGKQTYAYDPHLDPQLQWTGKAEYTSFEVPIVSLHVHERIDPRTIIEAVRRRHEEETGFQNSLFESEQVNLPLFKAVEFYKHRHNWTNRLIAGDSLLVMNSLLVKEGMAGSVQMVYFDPPYGIKYGSNFQPFVNKRDVKDGKNEDLTAEPETLKAFRDTWELGIHSYLTYMRDRLLLAYELLHDSGSIFVQISDENLHLVRNLLDEIFGVKNFVSLISFRTTSGFASASLSRAGDYLCWYGKEKSKLKYHQLYRKKELGSAGTDYYTSIELPGGTTRPLTDDEQRNPNLIPQGARPFSKGSMASAGSASEPQPYEFQGQVFYPGVNSHWKANYPVGMNRLETANRFFVSGNTLKFKRYFDDFEYFPLDNFWAEQHSEQYKSYVVQTSFEIVQRCLLMATDPGDLIFDPTCGSGTTAYIAEQRGRRWMTCDTSRVALTLAKQRLMTAPFDYYQLAKPDEGISSGFKYETVPHVTLKSIANNEPPVQETLYDRPLPDKNKARVTSPFTVEAVPAPIVQPLHEVSATMPSPADNSIARAGETLRQAEWRSELLRSGIRGRRGEKMQFSRVEPLAGTRFLHADAEIAGGGGGKSSAINSLQPQPARAVISFGPEHDPMPPTQVELALMEANKLFPKPQFLIFAAFQFDPVAVNNIEQTNWQGVQLLKVQMNADLLTEDLKKSRSSNESFWLIGQPDVQLREVGKNSKGERQFQVEVLGFDYYNVKEGIIESGGTNRIALWMLDTNFDGRSLFPHQVFFPMAGDKDGWARLAKNLKSEINEDLIEAYRGNVSLPFTAGSYKRIAVKIVDDRGIESLKLIDIL